MEFHELHLLSLCFMDRAREFVNSEGTKAQEAYHNLQGFREGFCLAGVLSEEQERLLWEWTTAIIEARNHILDSVYVRYSP